MLKITIKGTVSKIEGTDNYLVTVGEQPNECFIIPREVFLKSAVVKK